MASNELPHPERERREQSKDAQSRSSCDAEEDTPMKKVEIAAYGAPEVVAECVEAPDVGAPSAGEVVFDVLAFPINPADLSFCRGNYRLTPNLPATPGAECVGRITGVGAGVTDLKPGDLVINLERENWTQRRRVRAEAAIPIPAGLDLKQAAMLRINPATAQLLLEDHVALNPGDWVIQNVANSAVGRHLIVLARRVDGARSTWCGARTSPPNCGRSAPMRS
jgi:trans-2-enoyl-CoA reductase